MPPASAASKVAILEGPGSSNARLDGQLGAPMARRRIGMLDGPRSAEPLPPPPASPDPMHLRIHAGEMEDDFLQGHAERDAPPRHHERIDAGPVADAAHIEDVRAGGHRIETKSADAIRHRHPKARLERDAGVFHHASQDVTGYLPRHRAAVATGRAHVDRGQGRDRWTGGDESRARAGEHEQHPAARAHTHHAPSWIDESHSHMQSLVVADRSHKRLCRIRHLCRGRTRAPRRIVRE